MNNEEKIREIINSVMQIYMPSGYNVMASYSDLENIAMQTSQWKDEQFKQILQVIYSKTLSIEKDVVIEQIYKKLFGEDLDRNELEKDELKNILEKLKNVEL